MAGKRKGHVILVLGGGRSGKSRWARETAERRWAHPLFLATAEAFDGEMADRIRRHRAERGSRWRCVEETLDPARVIAAPPRRCDGILLDCVTVWLGNVLHHEGEKGVRKRQADLLKAVRCASCDVILVSNEVGLGIIPENKLARRFRDLAGWLNQALAAAADAVVFVVAGLPLVMKGMGVAGQKSEVRGQKAE